MALKVSEYQVLCFLRPLVWHWFPNIISLQLPSIYLTKIRMAQLIGLNFKKSSNAAIFMSASPFCLWCVLNSGEGYFNDRQFQRIPPRNLPWVQKTKRTSNKWWMWSLRYFFASSGVKFIHLSSKILSYGPCRRWGWLRRAKLVVRNF
jgi:hypothetical protein